MPIEIRELTVRVSVNPPRGDGVQAVSSGHDAGIPEDIDREAIVAECVEQVLEKLREINER